MSNPTTDELYWRAYSQIILSLLTNNAPLGAGNVVYVTPQSQRGIAAGKAIPEVVTNNLLYLVADSLLPGDSPLYNPGAVASYTQTLNQYLTWVDLTRSHTDDQTKHLMDVQTNLDLAQTKFNAEQEKAHQRFTSVSGNSHKAPPPFDQWVGANAPTLVNARRQLLSSSDAWYQAMTDYYCPVTPALKRFLDQLILANDMVAFHAGYNMPCTEEDINFNDAAAPVNGQQATFSINPASTFYRPSYSMQGYAETVDIWIQQFIVNPTKIKIHLDDGIKSSWSDLGFRDSEVNARSDITWSIFSTTVPTVNRTMTRNLPLAQGRSQISAELVISGMQSFAIGDGAWDVPGVRAMYPKLRAGAPPSLQTSLVKCESLLLAYGVGMNITFSSDIREEVDTMFKEAWTSGGSAKVFGFNISAPAKGATGQLTTFPDVKWDKDSGSMSIPPVNNGFPSLLGVLGRRL